jgi:hypothetical protein
MKSRDRVLRFEGWKEIMKYSLRAKGLELTGPNKGLSYSAIHRL